MKEDKEKWKENYTAEQLATEEKVVRFLEVNNWAADSGDGDYVLYMRDDSKVSFNVSPTITEVMILSKPQDGKVVQSFEQETSIYSIVGVLYIYKQLTDDIVFPQ